jgi:hypothetical protein
VAIRRYAEYARDRFLEMHDPSAGFGISQQEMRDNIAIVIAKSDEVCEDPELAAKAAAVIGFVTEAEAIDGDTSSLAARQRRVEEDYKRFKLLTEIGMADKGTWGSRLPTILKDVDFVTDQFFARHTTAADPLPAGQSQLLQDVIDRVKVLKGEGKTPVVVFDLDDTLLSPMVRSWKILREYAEQNPDQLSPLSLATIEAMKPEQLVFDLKTDLPSRFGVSEGKFLEGLMVYWVPRFFSSEYALDDPAYPGAPEYVATLMAAGAHIVYFTGRQEEGVNPGSDGMRNGTLGSLKKNGFPAPNWNDVVLFMKLNYKIKDTDYKGSTLGQIDKLGVVVAAFDNEPRGNALFAEKWPGAIVGRVSRCRTPNPKSIDMPSGSQRPPLIQDIFRPPASVQWI